jgi:replication factor C subunit 2/4
MSYLYYHQMTSIKKNKKQRLISPDSENLDVPEHFKDTDEFYHKNKISLFASDDDNSDSENKDNDNHNHKNDDNDDSDNYIEEIPWVEKYRPNNLDDIVEHNEIISILKKTTITGELPHLLLYGPPGTGKTSTIHAVTRELFGPKIIHDRVIELNASDDRGIGTVRHKIISFARISIGSKDPDYPCPDFKIVILDEADSMTPEAQAALRKVMEKMSKITRFCFICNYDGQIIEPITSRCMKLKFKPIRSEFIFKKIKYISLQEKLDVSDECLNTLIEISEGDARRTIMNLQNLQYLIKYKKNILPSDILQMTGSVDKEKFKNLWQICSSGNINQIRRLTINLIREGFVIKSILKYLMESIINSDLNDNIKSIILIELCDTDRKLSEGCSEYTQLLNILLFANITIKNH